MRIRKHAKLAGLSFTTAPTGCSDDLTPHSSGRFHSPHICKLNQSPWDVISFPPDSASSPFHVDGEESFTANGSSGNSLGAVESVASMRISMDIKAKNVNKNTGNGIELGFGNGGTIVCCKTWQCKKEASRGHALCAHHLADQVRAYNSLAHPSAAAETKSKKPATVIRRRGRPRKVPLVTAVTNPYEIYYYSGFGPRWGKKRGVSHLAKCEEKIAGDNNSNNVKEIMSYSSTSSSSQIDSEEFDYFEDDDDDDNVEESGGGYVKKRGRKPIKARSLKSLM